MNTPPNARSPSTRSRLVKHIGQVLVCGGLLTLIVDGPLQPHVAAMRSDEGVYIPNARYQFNPQEVASQRKTLSHTFTLYNGRLQPIEVEASADCGCTGLSWDSVTLPPFGHKEITASMNNTNRPSSVGINFKLGNGDFAFASLQQEKPS